MVSKLADMQTAIETELKNNSPLSLYPMRKRNRKSAGKKSCRLQSPQSIAVSALP
jgi:hypothetical protein